MSLKLVLLLLDDRQRITAIARQVRTHQSRVRPIGTGDVYSSPPALQGIAPRMDEPEQRWRERLELLPLSLEKAMRSAYQGISPVLARHLADEHDDAARARLATSVHELSEREVLGHKGLMLSLMAIALRLLAPESWVARF